MMRFLKIILFFVSVPLAAGFALALWPHAAALGVLAPRHIVFLSGAGACVVLYPWLRKSHFFRTFEHELTHLIAAKLFFARMESLQVHSSGDGEVRYSRESNFVIALAPYFLPLFAAGATLLAPALHPAIAVYALAPAGFLLAHHLIAMLGEILTGQPDIRESGRLFSFGIIALGGALTYGCIISYAAGDYPAVLDFLRHGPIRAWELAVKYAPMLFEKTMTLVKGLF